VKLVAFLRHPVERTFSEWLYLVRSGLVRGRSLRESLADDPAPIEHSRYAAHLASYVERFDREQVGIFLYDELQADPKGLAMRVGAFLGLDYVGGLDYERRVLAAAKPRSPLVARGVKAAATVTRAAGFPTVVGRVKGSRVASALYSTYSDEDRPRLSAADRAWLHSLLDPDLPALEALLGRDLDPWVAAS
jgi:hypothetical protein